MRNAKGGGAVRNLSKLVFQRVVAVSVGILLQIGFLIVMATYLRADFFWIRITMNVLSWAMVIYIISCGVNPSYKIAWIVLILAFPVAGLTIYLLFGGNKISSYEHRKMQSIEAVTMQQLQHVRTRDTSKTDSNNMRMQRQKVYIQSFMNTVLQQTKKDLTTPIDLFNASAPYSCTNLNPSKVSYLAQQAVLGGMNGIDMVSVPGQVAMGSKYAEFNVSEAEFYQLFLSIYYTKIE